MKQGIFALEKMKSQVGDEIVRDLNVVMTRYVDIVTTEGYRSTVSAYKDKNVLSCVADIENLLLARFGITIRLVSSSEVLNGPAAVLSVIPINDHVLYSKVISGYERVRKRVEMHSLSGMSDVYTEWVRSVRSLERDLYGAGVVVDLNTARISGLSDKIVAVIKFDLLWLFDTKKLTVMEMIAVLLHEVGHAWNSIVYTYRSARVTTSVIESIDIEMSKTNVNTNNVLRLVYEGIHKKKPEKNVTDETLLVEIGKKKNNDRTRGYETKDNEALADKFSVRFGLGTELINGLAKIGDFTTYDKAPNDATNIFTSTLSLFLLLELVYSLLGIASFLSMPIAVTFGLVIVILNDHLLDNRDDNQYDNGAMRIHRAKLDAIRQYRECPECSEGVKTSLRNYSMAVTEAADAYTAGVDIYGGDIDRVRTVIFDTSGSRLLASSVMDRMINDLADNSLHLVK